MCIFFIFFFLFFVFFSFVFLGTGSGIEVLTQRAHINLFYFDCRSLFSHQIPLHMFSFFLIIFFVLF